MDFAIVAKSEAVVKQLSNLFRACKLVRTTVAVCHGIVDVNKIVAQANGKLLSLDCVGVFKRNNASDYALSKICARWCPANSAAIKAIMKKAGNWIVGKVRSKCYLNILWNVMRRYPGCYSIMSDALTV